MKLSSTAPIKMLPYPKETIWGGSKLEVNFGKIRGDLKNIAESWELSAFKGQESFAQLDLSDESASFSDIFAQFNHQKDCPVLIKFIDSKSDLSIQVHPHIKKGTALPKNECWYIIAAEEDAKIAYGLKDGVSIDNVKDAIESNTLYDLLNFVSVRPGDFFYVPAGMIHAIGAGVTLLEIQQSSNTTYRLYDYDRTDSNGCKRELHIEEGRDAIKIFSENDIAYLAFSNPQKDSSCLCSCDYFSVYKIVNIKDCKNHIKGKNAAVTFISDGVIKHENEVISANVGDTFYIPPENNRNDFLIEAHHAVLTVF